MLRIGRQGRKLAKLRSSAPSIRADLSTVPKPSNNKGSGEKKAAARSGGGFPVGSLLALSAIGLGFVAYKKETDPGFAALVNDNASFLNTIVDPIQSAIKSSGLITLPTPTKAKETKRPVKEESKDTFEAATSESAEAIADSLIDTLDAAREEEKHEVPAEPAPVEEPVVVIDFPKEVAAEVEKATEIASAAAHHEKHAEPAPHEEAHVELSSSVESAIAGLPPVAAEARAKKLQSQAVAEVLDELAIQSAALRKELELTLLKDIDSLDAKELRNRLKQLAEQYFEKAKWETLRLHQSMRHVEADVRRQYVDKMAEQRAQLELEMNKIISEKEAELSKLLHARYEEQAASMLRAQAEGFNATMSKEIDAARERLHKQYEDELNHILAVTRQEHVQQQTEFQKKLEDVNAQLNGLNAAVNATASVNNSSVTLHQHSAAVLSLEAALSSSAPFANQLEAVKASSEGDALVAAVAESIESISTSGAPTLVDLRSRFAVVRNEVRKAALAPEGPPTIISQAIGNTLAAISKAPKGYVKGEGIEEVLARASFCLEQGNIKQALAELDAVSGYARVLMNDWESQAKSRLLADQSSKALRASAALRHSSFA